VPITVSGSPGVGPYTANIVPPVDAMPGPTRMRVQIIYSAVPDPCVASFSYGEVEDYTLVVDSDFTDWLTFTPPSGIVPGSNSTNIDVSFNSTDMEEGDYYADLIISTNDPNEPEVIVPCTLEVFGGIAVNLKAYLEGPFDVSEMTTSLNSSGFLPLSQPYNTIPWNYSGTENVGSIPNSDVVDWILIELRETPGDASTATSGTMIDIQAGFILKNGNIVNTSGSSSMRFNVEIADNLFAVIHHRNHLSILSANPLTLSGEEYIYDFTSDVGQAYGGINGHKEIGAGIWGMMAGDGNSDGDISNQDKDDVWQLENANTGYYSGDFDMNGQVNDSDKNVFWELNAGKSFKVVQ